MKYQIKCADLERRSMFYSDCEPALRNACVGHLRMDFGNGNEFYSSWWGNRDDLNNGTFKAELNAVVNELRRNGLLKNRSEMQRICSEITSLPLDKSCGFSVETDNHIFLLRCRPESGNYDCYCYCYNKRELALAQSQEQGEIRPQEQSL